MKIARGPLSMFSGEHFGFTRAKDSYNYKFLVGKDFAIQETYINYYSRPDYYNITLYYDGDVVVSDDDVLAIFEKSQGSLAKSRARFLTLEQILANIVPDVCKDCPTTRSVWWNRGDRRYLYPCEDMGVLGKCPRFQSK